MSSQSSLARSSRFLRAALTENHPLCHFTENLYILTQQGVPEAGEHCQTALRSLSPPQPAMNIDTIPEFLAEQRDAAPADLQHLFLSFEDLWERKLWHQLTDTLIEFFNHKESARQRLPFYKTFILTFADKINQLKLVTLALSAASQCRGMSRRHVHKRTVINTFADSQERLSFLTAVANKVNNPNSQDAYVYATVAVATVKLELKDLEGARKDLDKSEKILDGFDSVETIVHAAFYRVNAEYYQVCHLTKAERIS
jgi:26S proteasome regulatory subunit N9